MEYNNIIIKKGQFMKELITFLGLFIYFVIAELLAQHFNVYNYFVGTVVGIIGQTLFSILYRRLKK